LLSPVGGQTYRLGDSLRVTAAVEGNDRGTINAVEVFLSPDGGKTWGALSDQSLSVAGQSSLHFSWKIPLYFSAGGETYYLAENAGCKIRIAQKNSSDTLKTSISGNFAVEDTVLIRMHSPLGGESFRVGDTLRITWTVKDAPENPVDAVDVMISADSGKSWGYLRSSSILPQNPYWGRFPWVVRDSISILGTKTNLTGNPGVCVRVQQYSMPEPTRSFTSGMISISHP
jgi:hypothetical protein